MRDGPVLIHRETGVSAADPLDVAIEEASSGLISRQHDDGHWAFELEADATIPSEYILLNHFLGDIDDAVEGKLAAYLRATQGKHGGWPLYHDGDFNMSASVKAYYALKLTGEGIHTPNMSWARNAIRNRGGAELCNVFTRITLALFGQVPWRAVPVMRAEVMLAPKWFPFHLDKVSYWSRTVIVPLTVLMALKPRARNPPWRRYRGTVRHAAGRREALPRQPDRWLAGRGHAGVRPDRARVGAPDPQRSWNARPSKGPWRSSKSGSTAKMGTAAFSRPWPTR